MSGHVHAELMALYAEDARETNEPWKLWEFFDTVENRWENVSTNHPSWAPSVKYRRKRIPREFWVNVYDDEEDSAVYLHTSPKSAKDGLEGSTTGRTIHVREVFNDED